MGTTATTNYPGITVEAAFGTGMLTAASSWTDVGRCRGGAIVQGRQREDEPFRAGEMRLIMDNRDRRWDPEYTGGTYYPNVVPMLQVRLKVIYNAITYTLFYGYVETFNQDYPGFGADSVAELVVVDGFSVLGNTRMFDSVWDGTVASLVPSTWYKLSEKYGQEMGDFSGNSHNGAYGAPVVNNQPGIIPYAGTSQALLFDGVDDVGIAPLSGMTPNGDHSIAVWVKMPDEIVAGTFPTILRQDPGNSGLTPFAQAWTLRVNDTGYIEYQNWEAMTTGGANPRYSDHPVTAGRTYFIVTTYNSTTHIAQLYVEGILQSNNGAGGGNWTSTIKGSLLVGGVNGNSSELAWRGIIDDVVIFPTVLTGTNVTDLHEAGIAPWDGQNPGTRAGLVLDQTAWPALRDLDDGDSTLAPATLTGIMLDYLQSIADTEDGWLFMTADGNVKLVGRADRLIDTAYATSDATFGDGGGTELSYNRITVEPSNVQQIVNDVKVSRQGGIEQPASNSTSALAYGVRSRSLSGMLMSTDSQAIDRAAAEVLRNKDPGFRVTSLTIAPRRNPSVLFPKVFGYGLGQRITVKRRPKNVGSAISKDVHIFGIRHTFDAGALSWTTEWSTGRVDPNAASWAIVGLANVDQSDAHVAY